MVIKNPKLGFRSIYWHPRFNFFDFDLTALKIVSNWIATVESTYTHIRLNSSKHPQHPDPAKPANMF